MQRVIPIVCILGFMATGTASAQKFECQRSNQGRNFTLNCTRVGSTPPAPTGGFDIGIQDIRRYTALSQPAQWLKFNIRGYKNLTGRITINTRFHLVGGTFVDGSERITGIQRGQLKDALVIPSIYGANKRWTAVTFSVSGNLRCKDCRRHSAASITVSRNLTPGATDDPVELSHIVDEFQRRGIEAAR